MKQASFEANLFVTLLNAKFGDKPFTVIPGTKYDKVVYNGTSAHAFVNSDGAVLKAAGWSTPARGVRYPDVTSAADAADRWGSYLYA